MSGTVRVLGGASAVRVAKIADLRGKPLGDALLHYENDLRRRGLSLEAAWMHTAIHALRALSSDLNRYKDKFGPLPSEKIDPPCDSAQ